LKLTQLKLRQVEQTKLKDLKRQLQQKDSLLLELQNKVKSLSETNRQSHAVFKKEKREASTSSKNKNQIDEVEEEMESTWKLKGNNFSSKQDLH